jgi:hypothetical protein
MLEFVSLAGSSIACHFQDRSDYLGLLMSLGVTGEDWFRIELLHVLRAIPGITIRGTNQQTRRAGDRPDFTLDLSGRTLLIELKVIPKDRNYAYGWQRFQAGANNKKDFSNLVAGVRHGIVYVYWPDLNDWQRCHANIERTYSVRCLRQDHISCSSGNAVLSYWAESSVAQPRADETLH